MVALKVIILVHGHHPEDLFAALRHGTFGVFKKNKQKKKLHGTVRKFTSRGSPQQVGWVVNTPRTWGQKSCGTTQEALSEGEGGGQNGPECYGGCLRAHSEVMPRSLNALVVVRHAVDVAVVVDGEGNAIQGLGAHHAAEAAGVVRVPESLKDLRTQTKTIETPYFQFIFPKKGVPADQIPLWVFM